MPKIDVKDVKLGFWIGLGLFLFTTLASLLTRVWGKALESRDGS
jgi:hypothetical protein